MSLCQQRITGVCFDSQRTPPTLHSAHSLLSRGWRRTRPRRARAWLGTRSQANLTHACVPLLDRSSPPPSPPRWQMRGTRTWLGTLALSRTAKLFLRVAHPRAHHPCSTRPRGGTAECSCSLVSPMHHVAARPSHACSLVAPMHRTTSARNRTLAPRPSGAEALGGRRMPHQL